MKAALALVLVSSVAHAQDLPRADVQNTVEQPFLFLTDPHGPAPRQVLLGYALSASSTEGAIRPVPGNLQAAAVVHAVGLDVGILPRLNLTATALFAQPFEEGHTGAAAVRAGTRVLLTPPSSQRGRVALEAGILHEFGGQLGVTGDLTGAIDLGRVRLAGSLHVEHIFDARRDPIDLYLVAGASLRVASWLRLGAEYVAQDLEAMWDEEGEAEGGVRHYLGPDVALSLFRHHMLVTGGAAVQVAQAPGVLGRVTVAYVF